ncbi:MAG: hypothetical protein ABIH72_03895 [archaeon]
MDKNLKKLLIFVGFLVLALFFWRLNVYFFYMDGDVSFLRDTTGLNIHHYHYGIIILLIAVLIMIFLKVEKYSIALSGFGFGTILDGMASRLLSQSVRTEELSKYNSVFELTLFLFLAAILLVVIFYVISEKSKIKK